MAETNRRLRITVADVRDANAVNQAAATATEIYHFAAQVAVTTSLDDPRSDFEVNAGGTLNILEAARRSGNRPFILFTSTNKVYGKIGTLDGASARTVRYERHAVSESQPLDFYSPYGCSKGTADQYVIDYARSYGMTTLVFRMSCIYGPRQFGTEDQGWVAHFILRALRGERITLYGDGMQVRDILFIEDLVDAFLLAERHIRRISGQAFNIGGGPRNAISLRDLLDRIQTLHGTRPDVRFEEWRTGDQRYYVSDTHRFQDATGWQPAVSADEGIGRLYEWLVESRAYTANLTGTQPKPIARDKAPATMARARGVR
jgi:CDP-paratose 2-epimerase